MTRFLVIITTAIISLWHFGLYAAIDDRTFPPTAWTSKDQTEEVTIHNGSGVPLLVVINVNPSAAGANIKNCGSTTHIRAGSSAICSTTDPTSPVALSSDSPTNPASGTYQLKQQ